VTGSRRNVACARWNVKDRGAGQHIAGLVAETSPDEHRDIAGATQIRFVAE
jgi:hypothetical protein